LGSAGVYALFFASGAAALVYQVLWARWLGLVLGNTTTSVAIVLSAFMCGLALGSGWIGRRVAKIADPMRWYALIEWRSADRADLSAPGAGFISSSPAGRRRLFSDDLAGGPGAAGVRPAGGATSLMGATLPLLTSSSGDIRQRRRGGRQSPRSTLSAAVGILAASPLIELIGVQATTGSPPDSIPVARSPGAVASRQPRRTRPRGCPHPPADASLVMAALAASGAAAMTSECSGRKPSTSC
jgi:hypothetical protein